MIPEDTDKVSIIVVNWNGERFLKDCLGALSNQSYTNCEIILVDNGSADASVRLSRENFPAVKIVALKENRGFTGECRVEVARGAILRWSITTPAQKTWENLIEPMLRDRTIAYALRNSFSKIPNGEQCGDGLKLQESV
jgi:GT2 family glycosyltransferase